MKKKDILGILIILSIFFSSCGFKKVNNTNNKNIYIKEISIQGDKRTSYLLKNQILLISSPEGKNKIKLKLKIDKTKTVDNKNKQGRTNKYLLSIGVTLTADDIADKRLFERKFEKKISYNVAKNHSDTIDLEKESFESLKSLIADEITNFIKLYIKK